MDFKSQHDADRFGPLKADMTPHGELVSLPDLVRFMVDRDGWPLRDAALLLCDTIDGAAAVPELFETQPGACALRIGDVWSWAPLAEDKSFWESDAAAPSLTVNGQAGALQQLRDGWAATVRFPADLDREPCVRFAIRASVAADLFGYGAEVDAPPVLPSTLPQHDAKRWGTACTVEARPRDLVRLADVVRAALADGGAVRNGLAPKRAAAWVLDALADLGTVPWFELSAIDVPRPVKDSMVWRRGYPARPAGLQVLGGDEAEVRGLSIDQDTHTQAFVDLNAAPGTDLSGEGCPTAQGWCKADAALPALAELRGASGVHEWLRMQWVERIASAVDLDKGDTASLAVPARDVARLPWFKPAAAPGAYAETNDAEQKAAKKPGEKWTPAHLAELLRQHEALTTGPKARSVKAADLELGKLWSIGESNVKAKRLEAKKTRSAAASKSVAASVHRIAA